MPARTRAHTRMYAQWETEWLGWSKTPASCGNQCQSESSHLTVPSATGQQSWSTGSGQVVSNRDVCTRHAHTATVAQRPAGTGALRDGLCTTLRSGSCPRIIWLPQHPRSPARHFPRGCDPGSWLQTHRCPLSPV